ncbi:MAG: hypothetical protein H6737_14900 [Alphaproteobacteria bacterium]|nr:hypothetical protein [Alphaproteobacteria bacterium]
MRLALISLVALGCKAGVSTPADTDTDAWVGPPTCLPGGAEVTVRTLLLGGDAFDDAAPEQPTQVFTEAAAWDAFVLAWSVELPEPVDLDTEVVFMHPWVDGGCDEPPQYSAWRDGDQLRFHRLDAIAGGCEAYFPRLDLVVAARDGATDFDWCSTPR